MSSVNKVTLIGRLGRDPETRNFQAGGKVVNFRIATGEKYKDRDGNQRDSTQWHSIAIFNDKLGDVAERFLRKGSQVYLVGQLETRKWQDRDGTDRYTTEVVLRQFGAELVLLGGKSDQDEQGGADRQQRRGAPSGGGSSGSHLDDDIPFAPEVR